MEKLHKGTKWLFRIEGWIVGGVIAFLLSGFLFTLSGFSAILIVLFIFLIIVFGEIVASLVYNAWGYEFTQRELKIQKGVIIKTYKSIPYERIQNVDIKRGILARIFGYSTLDIQTAGYSGYGRYGRGLSEGHIPGVSISHAEKIREYIMSRISGRRTNQGL